MTVSANPLPTLFGPINTGATRTSTASRSIDLSTPVFTQADYDRKYGITAGPSLGTSNLLNNNIFGTPTVRPGDTVVAPEYLRSQNTPAVTYAAQQRQQASSADYRYQLGAIDRQAAARALAIQRPETRFNGTPVPAFGAQTPYQADMSRLSYLSHQAARHQIETPADYREFETLSLAYAGPIERFEISVAAVAGFVGGIGTRGGPLDVFEPLPQVRTARNRGGVVYGKLDALGRPTGVNATITREMIGTGTPASASIRPPGFRGGASGQARGHLYGAQLGGSGTNVRNLVTMQQTPANSPVMRGFEAQIRAAVEGGQTVNATFTPIYNGSNLVPRAITITGQGSGGFNIGVSVLNPQ